MGIRKMRKDIGKSADGQGANASDVKASSVSLREKRRSEKEALTQNMVI